MIEIARQPLADALKALHRMKATDATITTTSEGLEVRGGQHGMHYTTRIPADTPDRREWHLPVDPLHRMLQVMQADTITVHEPEAGEGRLILKNASGTTRIQIQTPSELSPPAPPKAYPLTVPDDNLARALREVTYAASRDGIPNSPFNGILLEIEGLSASIVATDGFRLARSTIDLTGEPTQAKAVLPKAAAEQIARDLKRDIQLHVDTAILHVRDDRTTIRATLEAGRFPDYRRVIPGQFDATLHLDAEQLLAAAKRVAILADRTSNHRIDVAITNDEPGVLHLRSSGPYGRGYESVPIKTHEGQPELALAYNGRYLHEALDGITGEINLGLNDRNRPSLFTPVDDPRHTALIVPLRTE